jgi:hypothetical protein
MNETQGHPTKLLELLQRQLALALAADKAARIQAKAGDGLEIPRTGKMIVGAYEQLRNATEYTEEHLLLQRAIHRFLVRTLFMSRVDLDNIGRELIVDLMQAGYLRDGEFGVNIAATIASLSREALSAIEQLKDGGIKRETAIDWALSDVTVQIETMLNPHSVKNAVAYTAYQHYSQVLPKAELVESKTEKELYEISLYIAVQQALLKSDLAMIRHNLTRAYNQSPAHLSAYIAFCRQVDELFLSTLTARLRRIVSHNAAPFRILRGLIEARPTEALSVIGSRQRLLEVFDKQINVEYNSVRHRINRGIVKSIIFIFITKVLIGLSIEVPYDLLVNGAILWMPLIINLTIPPVYMASLRLSLTMPASTNARALRSYIDTILYTPDLPLVNAGDKNASSKTSRWLFGSLFVVPFGLTVYILSLIGFNFVQAIIFFIFLSTASFLGFRLSTMIRELEMSNRRAGLITTIRDFFYLPFILFGQWLSGKYAKINVVSYFLDIAIELPLKNVLRLMRQWITFLNDRRDEII